MTNYMYVSLQGEDKVLLFTSDSVTGRPTLQTVIPISGGPAPIAVDPPKRHLYIGRRGSKQVSSFAIDQSTGRLTMTGTVPLETDPCFLSTDRKGRFLLASYYEGARVTIHPLNHDGAVGAPPVEVRPTARGAHSIQTDPSNRFAFVPHIAGRGPNQILQFRFDEQTGHLTPNSPPKVVPPRLDGPRHFCFHPRLDILYFSNEQGCSVTGYNFDPLGGTLSPFQTVSTLPAGYTGQNSCSKIQITPSGKFLYAPNRGHNSIAGFAVDPTNGRLTALGQTPSETIPRAFSLDPAGNFLYSAGFESGRLAAFRVDPDTGKLIPQGIYPLGARPMWVRTFSLG